jgi:hypothetical protein
VRTVAIEKVKSVESIERDAWDKVCKMMRTLEEARNHMEAAHARWDEGVHVILDQATLLMIGELSQWTMARRARSAEWSAEVESFIKR